ncbi:MAG: universal stress protein [Litoreibacter sp.]|nr:universal stress protein [Litoreibacter sp.]
MRNATILIVCGRHGSDAELSVIVERARGLGAHLAFLVVGLAPLYPLYAYGATPYSPAVVSDEWQEMFQSERAKLETRAQEIEDLLKRENVSGDVSTVCREPALIPDAVARRALLCDMAIVTGDLRGETEAFRQAVHAVLFEAPVGLLLNGDQATSLLQPDNVLVAWNTSRPAASAVHSCLPLLKKAHTVTIACFDPDMREYTDGENPGSDVAKWLTHHGCAVTVQQYPSGGKEIGACIQERARETGADLVVMGAYGHSRLREAVFGGTTQTMFAQADCPVFMAH